MDGVPGVSQCPIPPGGSFTYTFLADLYGKILITSLCNANCWYFYRNHLVSQSLLRAIFRRTCWSSYHPWRECSPTFLVLFRVASGSWNSVSSKDTLLSAPVPFLVPVSTTYKWQYWLQHFPQPQTVPYDIDVGPILLSDWYHTPYQKIVSQVVSTDINTVVSSTQIHATPDISNPKSN